MAMRYPAIGQWFQHPSGAAFEVVAIDESAQTIEIQLFDGTIDEIDLEVWYDLMPMEIDPPEDWSGSVDMDPEDFLGRTRDELPPGYQNPLAFLDRR